MMIFGRAVSYFILTVNPKEMIKVTKGFYGQICQWRNVDKPICHSPGIVF